MNIQGLINADYDFGAIFDRVKSAYGKVMDSSAVSGIWDAVVSFLSSVPGAVVTSVLLALALVEVFFGKRLLGIQKFAGLFVLGFAAGAVYLAPMIPDILPISPLVVGIVVGAVAAVLCKILYFALYIGIFGYAAYVVCMGGYYLPSVITDFTKDNMIVSLAVAAAVIVIAVLLKKLIEMIGTAALGSWLAWLAGVKLLATFSITVPDSDLLMYAVIGVLALLGTFVQIKTRKRKW